MKCFDIGKRVVCIDDDFYDYPNGTPANNCPRKNDILTIENIYLYEDMTFLIFPEYRAAFSSEAFRPVDEIKITSNEFILDNSFSVADY